MTLPGIPLTPSIAVLPNLGGVELPGIAPVGAALPPEFALSLAAELSTLPATSEPSGKAPLRPGKMLPVRQTGMAEFPYIAPKAVSEDGKAAEVTDPSMIGSLPGLAAAIAAALDPVRPTGPAPSPVTLPPNSPLGPMRAAMPFVVAQEPRTKPAAASPTRPETTQIVVLPGIPITIPSLSATPQTPAEVLPFDRETPLPVREGLGPGSEAESRAGPSTVSRVVPPTQSSSVEGGRFRVGSNRMELAPAPASLAAPASEPAAATPSERTAIPKPAAPVTVPTFSAEPTPVLAAQVPVDPGPPINPPTLAAPAPPRPHDVADLIDRLVAAREFAAPPPAQLAIAHREFGEVTVRFAADGNALAVTLASPDPDFARAVTAAAPTERQAPTGERGAEPQAARADLPARSEQRSADGGGNAPRPHPQRESAAQLARARPRAETPADHKSGIFA